MVEIHNVGKKFGHNEVLKDISLSVAEGTVVAILGPSGSGKSTLLRCINHLETVDTGEILVDGHHIGYKRVDENTLRELSEKELARQRAITSMVFQRFNLFAHKSVLENIIEGPVKVLKRPKEQAKARAYELLDSIGLRHRANAFPAQLSGGQQQRVAIARALAMDPRVILFDEPTSALDPELVGEVLTLMKKVAQTGITMLVVTHEIDFAREVADQVVFMADGYIVEAGDPDKVLRTPEHARTRDFLARVL
ncbi:amino acid ABC transporter ATP-binding protein [Paenarthrobacter sp. NPDC091711]|uniref:amino acid ABC transporter ATP-binding protein n=1 Tax=Paenarthrobacter sp. NPDC091711 TaxID=3364385 RepID=UPI00380F81C8